MKLIYKQWNHFDGSSLRRDALHPFTFYGFHHLVLSTFPQTTSAEVDRRIFLWGS